MYVLLRKPPSQMWSLGNPESSGVCCAIESRQVHGKFMDEGKCFRKKMAQIIPIFETLNLLPHPPVSESDGPIHHLHSATALGNSEVFSKGP